MVWMVLDGGGEVVRPDHPGAVHFQRGDVVLLPAALADASVNVWAGTTGLQVTVPLT